MTMRALSTILPDTRPVDQYGLLACAAMKTISQVGVDAWIAQEIAQPSSVDPHWIEFVIGWAAERSAEAEAVVT